MVSSESRIRQASFYDMLAKRNKLRKLLLENLERRDLMAVMADPIFAPGTPQSYVDQWENAIHGAQGSGNGSDAFNIQGSRWTNPVGGPSPNVGDPAVVTWSIVPDGTAIPPGGAGANAPSNLIAFMDGIYGTGSGPLSNRPWFKIVEKAYQRWSEVSGLTFVYEPNDDGAASGGTNRGVAGVRGDVRIGGRAIDGNAGILAFNYYPTTGGVSGIDGDMVIDTSDIFFRNFAEDPNAENRFLFNVLAHESGHGIGLGHSIPVNETKLMEPFASTNFYGPQHDDILGVQALYGDDSENNDTVATARDLGLLSNGTTSLTNRSIDSSTDVDYFKFSVATAGKVSIQINPVGFVYDIGNQGGSTASTDSLRYRDLSFVLEASDGTVLANVNAVGSGQREEIVDFQLPTGGDFRIRVNGNGSSTQLYNMVLRVTGTAVVNPDLRPPRLLSVAANSGEIFGVNRVNVLNESPRELIFRFDGAQSIDSNSFSGIKLTRAGNDGNFGTTDDIVITPAWVGYGDSQRVITLRFAAPLPDDVYKIEVLGVDIASEGLRAIRNSNGDTLRPRKSGTDRDTLFMNLELGAQVVAVVPQPVTRDVNGALVQARNQIEVYFNNDDLASSVVTTTGAATDPTVVNPSFYKVILNKDTVNPNDDNVIPVQSVTYDPALDKAVLTFAGDLDTLAGGAGTFRLRIGSNEAFGNAATPSVPIQFNFAADIGDVVVNAQSLGTLSGPFSASVSQEIRMTGSAVLPDYPGGTFDVGHRDIDPIDPGINQIHNGGADSNPDITVMTYSFALDRSYGVDSLGRPLFTSITSDQMARVREVFDFYSAQLGIDFIETAGAAALTVVVGDMAPNGQQSGPGGTLGVAGGGLAIMDQAEAWDNTFGNGSNIPGTFNFFFVALHEIGHLIGHGHAYDLPNGTIMGGNGQATPANNPLEWLFPGDADTIHGQYMYRPDNRDVDLYQFTVPAGQKGELVLETLAERLADASLVDTYLTLMKKTPGGLELVAINDNYFSKDSLIRANIDGGDTGAEYVIAVTARGNGDFNPLLNNTGSGATSAGKYELKMDFRPTTASQIRDLSGTAIDGDGDGLAGGNFDFWFRTAAPTGVAAPNHTIFVDKDYAGGSSDGSLARPFTTIPTATAAAIDGDIIRIAGTRGGDGVLTTYSNNPAYEIGDGGAGQGILQDGRSLDVPKGVTLMIDAGAIIKVAGASLLAGSTDASTDRSGSAIQVLGTPQQPVLFTSFFDETLGTDNNPLITLPRPGDWGGIEFRSNNDHAQGRRDREREGSFLNYVGFADIRYGGGQVGQGTQSRVVNPIHMSEARPTLLNNTIRNSADAGMSADPNSFEETTFTEPRYHLTGSFSSDYDRVGPVIRGNTFVNNSLNGLQIRIDTLVGQQLKPLEVAARIDDTDVTYILGENLVIQGTAGGPILESNRPDFSLVQLTQDVSTGTLTSGNTFSYVISYVDRFGGESLFSSPSSSITVGATGSIRLANLPAATGDFVSRRIWRSQVGGAGPFNLIAEINKDQTTWIDNGFTIGGSISPAPTSSVRSRLDASLAIDPGVVIKSLGSRIEVGFGATLLAEGTNSKPIVFTSRLDDRFGAGGTFDSNNDGSTTTPTAGNWAGIVGRHLSTISIDSALITFGGGSSSVAGGFASFNAVESHQGTLRLAHSVLENNASGVGNVGTTNRDAHGPNDGAVVYVMGGQPIIVDNVIRNSASPGTAAISIDANSMTAKSVTDYGRSTGTANRVEYGLGNMGPLVQQNKIGGNAINGMRVRGATLTTESVWDDTDIVHVLQSEIAIPDFHSLGGLRLQSKVNESLVVKLEGNTAGFTASGRPLDNPNRIGGSLQVIGAPGFPVILTSLTDDSVGAGFDPEGRSQSDTDGAGITSGIPGSWRGIVLDAYSNDRNVETTFELEADKIQDRAVNDVPFSAQNIGDLSSTLSGGDENLRLGFTVHGSIAAPSDLDVYQFTGVAGSMIWIDVDRTGNALDSVVELVDANGRIIAMSDNSFAESVTKSVYSNPSLIAANRALVMDSSSFATTNALSPNAQVDFQSINPLDAGFRLVLPGVAGSINPYYVRVRSSNLGPNDAATKLTDPNQVLGGISTGPYRLQVRLQQTDEVGGSTIRFAEIRNAVTGIQMLGMPGHSPLLGTISEGPEPAGGPSTPANSTVDVGNLGNSDRAELSIAAQMQTRTDVDWFRVGIHRDSVQDPNKDTISTVFDIDYADGLGRPDTTLWVYKEVLPRTIPPTLQLVLIGTDSDIADDRAAPNQGSDADDLTRGSFGSRDPFIGASELPDGTYYIAVTNSSFADSQLNQFTTAAATTPTMRIEPTNGVLRYSVDRFENNPVETASGPIAVSFAGNANAVPYTLADVALYTVHNNGASNSKIRYFNGATGAIEADVSDGNSFANIEDFTVLPDGRTIGFQWPQSGTITDANSGSFITIDATTNGNAATLGTSGITTWTTVITAAGPPPTFAQQQVTNAGGQNGVGVKFTALTSTKNSAAGGAIAMFGVASRGGANQTYQSAIVDANGNTVGFGTIKNTKNILYRINPDSGAAVSATPGDRTGGRIVEDTGLNAGTNIREYGYFNPAGVTGTVTGLTDIGGTLFAVTDAGELMRLNIGVVTAAASAPFGSATLVGVVRDPAGNAINFTGLTAGPRNIARLANTLFGVSTTGQLFAFSTTGVLQAVFPQGTRSIALDTVAGAVAGIDFSPTDVNLWHVTGTRGTDAGHGQQVPFDGSRTADQNGNNSLYFGFEDPNATNRQPGAWTGPYDVAAFRNTYNMPGGASGSVDSNRIDLRGYSADDQPMLYFNYFLETENKNSPNNNGDDWMRDAFRVYGAGTDGTWVLLATNNSTDDNNYLNTTNEFDPGNTLYTDNQGKNYKSQELFDNTGAWRQARVSLAPFAGQSDVRIRFEFSTQADMRSADPLRGGIEVTAIDPTTIEDGDTFTVQNARTGISTTFEFDLGLVLNMPSGKSIPDGSIITVEGLDFTFVQLATGGIREVVYNAAMAPSAIAAAFKSVLQAAGFGVFTNSLSTNVLNVKLGATAAGVHGVGAGLDPAIIIGTPGVAIGNEIVDIHQEFTTTRDAAITGVRDAIRSSFARALNDPTVAGNSTNIAAWDVFRDSIRMLGYNMIDQGKLAGLYTATPGDAFENEAVNRRDQRAQNNAFGGVFIDDIIVGFAERGEMVYDYANVQTPNIVANGVLAAGGMPFTGQAAGVAPIETGTYQLFVRTGAEYGMTDPKVTVGNANPTDPPHAQTLLRTFDTNDRLARQTAIQVSDPAGIVDGDIFTLSDGYNTATFEFDVLTSQTSASSGVQQGRIRVLIDPRFTVSQVADAIRDAINSPSTQAILKINATSSGKNPVTASGVSSNNALVYLHGTIAGDVFGGTSLTSSLLMVQYGQDVLGEDLGDANRFADQGQVIVSSTIVRDSSGFGVVVDAGNRTRRDLINDAGTRPMPGSPKNLVTLNTANLAPGAVLMNNVFANNGSGGVLISGDTVANSLTVPSMIARVINNTVVGLGAGVGVQVETGASPTLLNNIFFNLGTGVTVDAQSTSTVLGANLYKGNATNTVGTGLGSFAITLSAADPLFANTSNGRYYPAPLSQAIDSSLASLQERTALSQVKNAVSLPPSPMVAPTRDLGGLLRVDDPAMNTPAGQGQNVFIDRGAVDRADFNGPIAVLINPLDNDSNSIDTDRNDTYVRLSQGNLTYFSILLSEPSGTGPDPATVTASNVILTENGRLLIADVDYAFTYSVNSHEIRLTPFSGTWRRDSIYEITLNNAPRVRLDAPISTAVQDGDTFVATQSNGSQVTFEYESGFVLQVPQTLTLTIPATGAGPGGLTDGQRFRVTNGAVVANFELDTDGVVTPGNRRIAITPIASTSVVRDEILNALLSPANVDLNLAPKSLGTDKIHLGSLAAHTVTITSSLITVQGSANGVTDGQLLTVTRLGQPSHTFEFNLQGDASFNPSNTQITVLRSDTNDEIADKIATALRATFADGFAPVSSITGGVVHVGGKQGDLLDVSASRLALRGQPGVTSSLRMTVPPTGGAAIADGNQFSLRVGATTVVFEFTKDLSFTAGTRAISISNSDSAATVASRIASTIASASLGITPTSSGAVVTLNEPLGTVLNLLTSPLTSTGVPGGAVPVYFVPSTSFTRTQMSGQITRALNTVGLGIKATNVGDYSIFVEGVQSVAGITSSSVGTITDYAGNALQPNRANALTQFTIVMPEVVLDYGDAPGTNAATLQASNGARHAILPEDEPLLVLGSYVDADNDGQPEAVALGDDLDSSVSLGSLPLQLGTNGPGRLRFPVPTVGLVGRSVTVSDPRLKSVTLEFVNGGAPSISGAIAVNIAGLTTANQLASAFSTALLNALLAGRIDGITPIATADVVSLGGTSSHQIDTANAPTVVRLMEGSLVLSVQANMALYADGQTMTIQDGSGNTVTFELNSPVSPVSVAVGNIAVNIDLGTATPASLASAIAAAINGQIALGNLKLPTAVVVGATITLKADDEDGVRFDGLFNARSNPVPVVITSSGVGVVDAWIDWNDDGDFLDAGEKILSSQPVRAGENTFLVTTPATAAIGFSAARFRLSTMGGLLNNGVGVGGEVEDYLVEVLTGTPPVAVTDSYTVDEDQVLTVTTPGVLVNDTDVDGGTITVYDQDALTPGVQPLVAPRFGTLVLNANGSFVYDSDPDFFGTDYFVYNAYDGRMISNTPVTVTLTVYPVNDTPVANDDTLNILEDEVVRLPGSTFWANDYRAPFGTPAFTNEAGQTLTLINAQVILPSGATRGLLPGESVAVVNDELQYTPPTHYNNRINGPILLKLTIQDGGTAGGDDGGAPGGGPLPPGPLQSSSTLTVNLAFINDAPVYTMPTTTSTFEDSGNVSVPSFVTGILPGPALASDEVTVDAQVVSFRVRALDPSLFAVQPALTNNLNGTATLTYRLAADVNDINRPRSGADFRIEVIAVDNARTLPAYGAHNPPHDDEADPQTFTISVAPRNDAPEFGIPNDRPSVIEDAGPQTITGFLSPIRPGTTTSDDETIDQTVVFTVTAVDPTAFRTLPAISPNGTLTYELAAEVNSSFKDLTVTVFAIDNGTPTGGGHFNTSITQTFSIVAAAINDAPIFAVPVSTSTEEDSGDVTVVTLVTGILPGPALATDEVTVDNQVVSFQVRALDPTLFATQPAITNNGDGTARLTYKLAPNVNNFNRPVTGADLRIEVIAIDNGRTYARYGAHNPPNDDTSDPKTFLIDVSPRNDAPEFTIPNVNPTSIEDGGPQTVSGFATGIRPGPVDANDEASQTVDFFVTARDPSAFRTLPAISRTGVLTYELATDVNSRNRDLTVDVYLQDDGLHGGGHVNRSATQSFSIVATSINDAPVFTIPNTTTTWEDAGNIVVVTFATGILPGASTATDEVLIDNQVVTFNVRALDPSLFAIQPTLTNNGNGTATLRYQLAADVNNNNRPISGANLRVEVIGVDNGRTLPVYGAHNPPNDDDSAPQTFTIDVSPRNDAPEFTLPNVFPSVNEDAGPVAVPNFATNIRPGTTTSDDEASQTLIFVVTPVDPSAFRTLPAISPTGVLTYELDTDVNSRFKDLTVQVVLQDSGPNGPVAQGGNDVNRSAVQTFSIVAQHINDAPDFAIPVTSITVLEDNEIETGLTPTTFAGFATGIVHGPTTALDEPLNQDLQFNVISVTNSTLFATQPAISPSGNLTFVTAKDQNGQSVVVVQLQDRERLNLADSLLSARRTFTINVTSVNDAPEFDLPTTQLATEDQGVVRVVNFATNLRPGTTTSTDENGQTFTVTVTAADPTKFALQPSIAADGTLQFRTAVDVNGSLPVTVFLTDDGPTATPGVPHVNRSIVKTFTINVAPINDAPLFTIPVRQLTIDEDREEFLGIPQSMFSNFVTDILMGPLTAVDEQQPNQLPTFLVSTNAPELFSQQPSVDANGTLIFKTAPNKNGRATVTIRLQDSGASSPAPNSNISSELTITLTINPINDAPLFNIPASITSNEDQGVVSITGFATNVLRGPLGADDESTQEVTFVAVANDPNAFEIQPTILADGTLSFKTALNVNKDTRTTPTTLMDFGVQVYLVDNGVASPLPHNNRSITKSFSVNVLPVNDSPIPDSFVIPGVEDTSIDIQASDVLIGDLPGPADEAGQSLFISQVQRTSDRGGVIVPVFSGSQIVSFRYTPPLNMANADIFRYVVTDNGSPARSATGTITVNVAGVNDQPQFTVGAPQVFTFEDSGLVTTPWASNILAGPPAALDEISGPSAQTVSFELIPDRPELFSQGPSIDANGVLSFTPAPNANGQAIIAVTAVDSGSGVAPNNNRSSTAFLTVSIAAVNDAPVFTAGGNVSANEDGGPQVIAWATGIAPAGGILGSPATANDEASQTVDFIVTPSSPSLFSVQPTISRTGQLQFTPAPNAFGVTTVTVVARDSGAGDGLNQNTSATRTFTLTINPTNDAPFGNSDSYATNEDTLLTISAPGILANDSDIDLPADTLSAVRVSATSTLGAAVTVNADGSISYDPRGVNAIQQLVGGQSVIDQFTYRVRDAAGAESEVVTVSVAVSGINDAPVAVNDSFPIGVNQATLLAVLSNDTDVDSPIDARTIEIGNLPINGTVRVLQTGRIEYTPRTGFRGADSFSYRVRDSLGLISNEATVSVDTNAAPLASNDSITTRKDQSVVINVLRNDVDSDGSLDPSTVQIVVPASTGSTSVATNGLVTYTPPSGFSGTVTFSYTVADNKGAISNVATVTVLVSNAIYQNTVNNLDVNADGFVSPIDALLIINDLNLRGSRPLDSSTFIPPPFIDVNGDNVVAPFDALTVINYLNLNGSGEGEQGESQLVGVANEMDMIAAVGPMIMRETQALLADAILEMSSRRVATVPAAASYRDGQLEGVDHSQESLEDVLHALSWNGFDREGEDDVFGSGLDDLLR